MKYKIYILKIILLVSTFGFAQIDTTSLSYYPLNDGNYWEYEDMRVQTPPLYPCTTFYYYSVKVVGDTTLSNLKKYKIIKIKNGDNLTYKYERIDSLNYNVYRYRHSAPGQEYLIDSLKVQEGDTSRSSRIGYFPISNVSSICFEILQDTIVGKISISKKFRYCSSGYRYNLSTGLGLTYTFNPYMYEEFTANLKYAVINGVEYGSPVITGIKESGSFINKFQLFQNYPNPFNPITKIQFSISKTEFVILKIFNLKGEEVATLVSDKLNAGNHKYFWDATNYASGVYIIVLQNNKQSQTKKCLLIK